MKLHYLFIYLLSLSFSLSSLYFLLHLSPTFGIKRWEIGRGEWKKRTEISLSMTIRFQGDCMAISISVFVSVNFSLLPGRWAINRHQHNPIDKEAARTHTHTHFELRRFIEKNIKLHYKQWGAAEKWRTTAWLWVAGGERRKSRGREKRVGGKIKRESWKEKERESSLLIGWRDEVLKLKGIMEVPLKPTVCSSVRNIFVTLAALYQQDEADLLDTRPPLPFESVEMVVLCCVISSS